MNCSISLLFRLFEIILWSERARIIIRQGQRNTLRKFLSILLLAGFGLPLVSPLLALGATSNAGLPACCRRNGKHHCVVSMTERSKILAHGTQISGPIEKCPYCPTAVAVTHHDLLAIGKSESVFASLVTRPAGRVQTESKWRISRDRSRQKRGPPAKSLL
jgi:hypothetical protein